MLNCKECGVRQRVSHNYDDRDPDTVNTLTKLIKSSDPTTPTKLTAIVVKNKGLNVDGVLELDLECEPYVRLLDIPEPLRSQVKEALKLS